MKWIVCGILFYHYPIIGVITFIIWLIADYIVAQKQYKIDLLNDSKLMIIKDSNQYGDDYSHIDFNLMLMETGEVCYDCTPSKWHLFRDVYANWFIRYTEETKNILKDRYRKRASDGGPLADKYAINLSNDLSKLEEASWVGVEMSFNIESAYQRYLVAYNNLIR